jgi:glutathione peroxidase
MNIYELSFTDNSGNEIKLESFKGKDILIVNTASQCGYTKQYEDLQKIQSDSIVVIGFPCNQFGNQEPGTTEEIKTFCTNVYGITFPISQKVEVNGPNAHPVYKYLKESSDITNIGWNFEKFLVSKDGSITHYPSSHQVSDII